jgi:galactonate dehydratase
MHITRFEIIKVPPSWVWLKIHTNEGSVGLGEPYLENQGESVIAEVLRLEPLLVGRDPQNVEALWQTMYTSGLGYTGGPIAMSAMSGIDMALWDLAGKAAGLPIHRMLGGRCRDRVRMYRASFGAMPYCVGPGLPYWHGGIASDSDEPRVWEESARILVRDWGFRCLKVHFEPGDGLEAAARIPRYVEQFAAVREGAGPSADVAVDIHNPHPAIARQFIEALAPYRPLFVEEPMQIERVETLAQVARDARVPIAAGERWMGKWVFYDALRTGALAVVQPDICHAGGITECRKIAAIAEAAYAKVALHCPLSPLALAASLQLDAALPNFLVQEHNEVNDWFDGTHTVIGKGYLKQPFVLDVDGCVNVPDGPGLGIELDEDGFQEVMTKPWHVKRG